MKEKIPKSEIHKSILLCLGCIITTTLNTSYVLCVTFNNKTNRQSQIVSLLQGLELGL